LIASIQNPGFQEIDSVNGLSRRHETAQNGHVRGSVDGDAADAVSMMISIAGMPGDLDVGVGSPDEGRIGFAVEQDRFRYLRPLIGEGGLPRRSR